MDWGRAKTVLILSFLFLNLLLVYQMWVTRWDPTIASGDAAEMKKEAGAKLDSKNIRVLADIPAEVPKLQQISVNFVDNSGTPSLITLPAPISFANRSNKSEFHAFAARAAIKSADSYALDPVLSKADAYVFDQVYGKLPLFDVTLQLFVKQTKVTGYKQAIVAVQSEVSPKAQKAQRIISAYTALRSISEYLPSGSVISDVRLGYHGQNFDSAAHPLLPYWRIALDNGQYFYVQAFSGAVESSQNQS